MHMDNRYFLLSLFLSASVSAAPVKSLCAENETVAYTCHVKGGKIASLCISPDLDKDHGYMYYAFGTPKRVEMKYPQEKTHPGKLFNRKTMTTGPLPNYATGFYVSFVNRENRYFLYTLDWLRPEGRLPHSGIVVAQDGKNAAITHLRCRRPQEGFQDNPSYDSDRKPDPYDVLGFDPDNPSDRVYQTLTQSYDEDGKIMNGGLPKLKHGKYLDDNY